MALKNYLLGLLLLCLLQTCVPDKGKNIPDVSAIPVNLNIHRFEKQLFSIDTLRLAQQLQALEKEHPTFSKVYFNNVIGIRKNMPGDEKYLQTVSEFLSFKPVRQLYDTTMLVYDQLDWLQDELKLPLRLLKHYFPELPNPQLYTFISEYSFGCFTADDNILAIGLDFFLGQDYPHYNPSFFPAYIRRSMNKEHMSSRAMQAVVDDLAGEPKGRRLLDIMLHNGKKLYVLDHLLPYTPDSIKLAFTAAQTEWLPQNEQQMWAYLLDQQLLYVDDYQKIRKLVEHSPHSPGMPPEAPGRTANWLGWQIVKNYMSRHPNTSMQALLALGDAQELLQKSKYKPRR